MPQIWKFIQTSSNCRLAAIGASWGNLGQGNCSLEGVGAAAKKLGKVMDQEAVSIYEGCRFYCGW